MIIIDQVGTCCSCSLLCLLALFGLREKNLVWFSLVQFRCSCRSKNSPTMAKVIGLDLLFCSALYSALFSRSGIGCYSVVVVAVLLSDALMSRLALKKFHLISTIKFYCSAFCGLSCGCVLVVG